MDLSGLTGLFNSGAFQGGADLAGRLGNALSASNNGQQVYKPQGQQGLAGISNDLSMINGAPVKLRSSAMPIQGMTPMPRLMNSSDGGSPLSAPPSLYGVY